jgi:ubiquinone/menaquinone biosynthesis C-methylase UbiE
MTGPRGYVLPSTDAESRRLGRQARLYGGVEVLEHLLAAGPAEVLDVGCGAGHYALMLARRLPGARVTGLELDATRLAQARAWHLGQADNLAFVRGQMHALPLAAGSFELVSSRFVLLHDSEPVHALRELARVTRPGGVVVAHDLVHDGIWFSPERPAFTRLLRAVIAIMRGRGVEPDLGLHLAGLLERAGLEQVQLRVLPHVARRPEPLYRAYRDNWLQTVASLAEQLGDLLQPGLAAAARDELEQEHPGDLVVEISVLAWGRAGR